VDVDLHGAQPVARFALLEKADDPALLHAEIVHAAAIFMCIFGFRSGRKTTRCGRARARSAAAIVRAWLRTPKDYSKHGRMTGRWWRITASEPAPAIF
jgi:hypothetical protein